MMRAVLMAALFVPVGLAGCVVVPPDQCCEVPLPEGFDETFDPVYAPGWTGGEMWRYSIQTGTAANAAEINLDRLQHVEDHRLYVKGVHVPYSGGFAFDVSTGTAPGLTFSERFGIRSGRTLIDEASMTTVAVQGNLRQNATYHPFLLHDGVLRNAIVDEAAPGAAVPRFDPWHVTCHDGRFFEIDRQDSAYSLRWPLSFPMEPGAQWSGFRPPSLEWDAQVIGAGEYQRPGWEETAVLIRFDLDRVDFIAPGDDESGWTHTMDVYYGLASDAILEVRVFDERRADWHDDENGLSLGIHQVLLTEKVLNSPNANPVNFSTVDVEGLLPPERAWRINYAPASLHENESVTTVRVWLTEEPSSGLNVRWGANRTQSGHAEPPTAADQRFRAVWQSPDEAGAQGIRTTTGWVADVLAWEPGPLDVAALVTLDVCDGLAYGGAVGQVYVDRTWPVEVPERGPLESGTVNLGSFHVESRGAVSLRLAPATDAQSPPGHPTIEGVPDPANVCRSDHGWSWAYGAGGDDELVLGWDYENQVHPEATPMTLRLHYDPADAVSC